MSIELKPCPFCGGEAEMMGDQYPYVECHECGAGFTANHSYEFDEEDAASNWNSRRFGQDKMKRIAEKKIEQLGGEVCGVLVRKDGKLAAVDEHGRVQWLQSGPGAEPVYQWREIGETDWMDCSRDWKEKCDESPEHDTRMLYPQPAQQSNQEDVIALLTNALANIRDTDASAKTLQNMAALALMVTNELATTHQPAQQGSVPEEAASLARKWLGITESSLLHNDDITKMAEALLATSQPAKQGVPEEEERLTDIYRRKLFECQDELNNLRSEYHNRTAELETEIEYLQEELQSMRHQPAVQEGWKLVPVEPTTEMRYAYHEAEKRYLDGSIPAPDGQWWAMLDAAPTAPQPQGDGWVKCSERLPTEADADSEGNVWFCWPDGDMRLVHYKKIQLPYHSEHHWKPTGLKRPQPPKEGA